MAEIVYVRSVKTSAPRAARASAYLRPEATFSISTLVASRSGAIRTT